MPPVSLQQITRPDGTTIAFDVAGDGPAVVLVHGITNRREAWQPVSDLLIADFTCVRVDLRGHGASSEAPEYSVPSMVGDVQAVVAELGLTEPAIVGHSLGGTIAAVHAALHGARAAVCIDQSLRFGDFAARVQPHAEALRGEGTMRAVMDIERELGIGPYAGGQGMEDRVLAFPREVVLGIWEQLLTTPPEQLTATAEALLPYIKAPFLCLHGAPPPPDYGAWLRGLVPQATVEVWDGAGHMLHLVETTRFVDRVRPFLS